MVRCTAACQIRIGGFVISLSVFVLKVAGMQAAVQTKDSITSELETLIQGKQLLQ